MINVKITFGGSAVYFSRPVAFRTHLAMGVAFSKYF
jgi:hypothetical protein